MSNRKIKQNGVKMTFFVAKFDIIYVFWHEESEFEVYFETGSESEVEIMVFLRMRSNKIKKNCGKCH